MNENDCILKHPHSGRHLTLRTVKRRLLNPKWDNRCIVCGKKTGLRKEFREDMGWDIYLCSDCLFKTEFSREGAKGLSKEIRSSKKVRVTTDKLRRIDKVEE